MSRQEQPPETPVTKFKDRLITAAFEELGRTLVDLSTNPPPDIKFDEDLVDTLADLVNLFVATIESL